MSAQDLVDEFKVGGAFHDRPLKGEQKIQKLITAVQTSIGQAEYGVETATSVAASLAEDDKAVEKIESDLFQVLDHLAILKSRLEVIEGYNRRLKAQNDIAGIVKDYEQKSEAIAEQRRRMTKRQKFRSDELYKSFREQLWEAVHPDEPCPNMNQFLEREEGDADEDDEIEIGGQTQTYRCPITLTLLEDAVISSTCKHSYSRAAVVSYIQSARPENIQYGRPPDKTKCPVAGCGNKRLSLTDIKPDKMLQARADKFAKRQAGRVQEDSDEEVI